MRDLLAERKGFKLKIILKSLFLREKENDETEYSLQICFNSNIKTVTNDLNIHDSLETSYQFCQEFKMAW